jgi:NAD-dependent dihydropyrimidine dehydrogenase PreA subunit
LPQGGIEFFNMRVDSVEKIISSLAGDGVRSRYSKDTCTEKTGDWIPWFPVIDYDRCKNCKQCPNFCLFGVYKLSVEGKVEVCNPANCKTNCPACARLCLQSAIIFPKYSDSPINGNEVSESASGVSSEKMKADLASLLGGNVYDAIRRRSKNGKRFSRETDRKDMPQTKL